jgi:two-component system nitrogen regulation sensor histidine kinase NtrY
LFKRKTYALILTASLLLLSLFVKLDYRTENQQPDEKLYQQFQRVLHEKEFVFVRTIQQTLSDTTTIKRNWSEISDVALKEHIGIYVFTGDTLILWSNNLTTPQSLLQKVKPGTGFQFTENGYYLTHLHNKGSYQFLLTYLIKHQYAYKNQYLKNDFAQELSFASEAEFSDSSLVNHVGIKNLSGVNLFFLKIKTFDDNSPAWIKIGFALLLFFVVLSIHGMMRYYVLTKPIVATLVFIGFWLLIRALGIFFQLPHFLYEYKLFNPQIYASSNWFPSLGDLLVDSIIVLWLFILLESRFAFNRFKPVFGYPAFIFWLVLSIMGAHVSIVSIKSLAIDSQISFDISNLFNITFFTYIGLLVVIVQMLTVYFVIRNFNRIWEAAAKPVKMNGYFVLLTLLGLYAFIMNLSILITAFQIFATTALFITMLFYKKINSQLNRFQQYFGLVFIIALFSAIGIQHWTSKKEHEERKLFAVRLISQNDITTDYFLRNIEKRINQDAFISEYFTNPLIGKNQFDKRIRQLYFTGYLSKYELIVLDYDTMGYHFKSRNEYSYRTIQRLYENESSESINKHFRYLSSNTETKGYIARFDVQNQDGNLGILYILLKPKLIQDENRFDELLIEGFRAPTRNLSNYSYAVYKDKNLMYQSGNFPYRIKNTWGDAEKDFHFFEEDEYEHMLYTDVQPITVVVSKFRNHSLQTIGLFSFIFTLCTLLLVLILFSYVALNAQLYKKYQLFYRYLLQPIQSIFNRLLLIDARDALFLRTRIQTAIIFILFISLLFSAYFTISFITQKYDSRQTERLMKKLRNVVLTVENENIKQFDQRYSNELEAFINEIADLYDTDINLYNPEGKILASSISKIYDEKIVSEWMPSMAYYHLKLLKESQFNHDEVIGKLTFQAAYAPVFKNKSEVLGYIQLPYFSQQADLVSEISSVIIGFINLYVVLFIFIGVIAYVVTRNISYPLALIQERLSGTKLGEINEPIQWTRNDEIGELVTQYNRMIAELELSARKIAETEREGAWREIARQIAHEIKNPLTPMKLSIQHLQRAFANNDPNIQDKVNRTSQLLVKQIDMLSELATEFSSFAKMPEPIYEWMDMCRELTLLVDLYRLETTHQIVLNCQLQTDLYFDRSYFNRSVGNIIKNALQSIPENEAGLVQVNAIEHNECFKIYVIDNGSGMSDEQAAQIFKPYFSTKVTGMGLGLPIVKNMIESGNGNITFSTTFSKGTEFVITLPKHEK